jgi:hypothetical protein
MTWATVDEVLDVTGPTVTATMLAQASSAITIYSNRTEAASSSMGTRDLHWLNQATCWQAAWLLEQPGWATRSRVDTVQQDAASVTYTDESAIVLAPLAVRALRNLSWKGGRTGRVPGINVPQGGVDPRSEAADCNPVFGEWQPLPGGRL